MRLFLIRSKINRRKFPVEPTTNFSKSFTSDNFPKINSSSQSQTMLFASVCRRRHEFSNRSFGWRMFRRATPLHDCVKAATLVGRVSYGANPSVSFHHRIFPFDAVTVALLPRRFRIPRVAINDTIIERVLWICLCRAPCKSRKNNNKKHESLVEKFFQFWTFHLYPIQCRVLLGNVTLQAVGDV